jgi:hypothetical protein
VEPSKKQKSQYGVKRFEFLKSNPTKRFGSGTETNSSGFVA